MKTVFDGKKFVKTLPNEPGVYRMISTDNQILYVGKAGQLKKRVGSYFTNKSISYRIKTMVSQVQRIEISVTNTENEALLLENELIKSLKPKYNVLLRDDKSYPYIVINKKHRFPKISFYRGAKRKNNQYYGPFPSVISVKQTIDIIQKIFKVRSCPDNFFKNRSRPCLEYQIKRCTAPCVGYISEQKYNECLTQAEMFLKGQSNQLIEIFIKDMENSAQKLDYESAAFFRDKISKLQRTQQQQFIGNESTKDFDVIACHIQQQTACIQVFFFRNGRNLGNRPFFVNVPNLIDDSSLITEFLPQYYMEKPLPSMIVVHVNIDDKKMLESFFSSQKQSAVTIIEKPKKNYAKWLKLAQKNAEIALKSHLLQHENLLDQFKLLKQTLKLSTVPQRIECFDISHTAGQQTVASCVVFNQQGFVKSDYRKFNISNITPGDDVAAMKQAVERHYKRLKEENELLPDILLIDGGKTQYKAAFSALEEIKLPNIKVISIAKGKTRKPGFEMIYVSNKGNQIHMEPDSNELHLLQRVRDEAHRFAINAHRSRRKKQQQKSLLQDISGIGTKRKKELIKYFGGLQSIKQAKTEDIKRVPGFNQKLAEKVYAFFHQDLE